MRKLSLAVWGGTCPQTVISGTYPGRWLGLAKATLSPLQVTRSRKLVCSDDKGGTAACPACASLCAPMCFSQRHPCRPALINIDVEQA